MNEESLFRNEKILNKYSPKMISFFTYYIPYFYLILLGILYQLNNEEIIDIFGFAKSWPGFLQENIPIFVLIFLLLIPSVIYGLYKISFRMVFLFSIITIAGIYLHVQQFPSFYIPILITLVGIIGILYTDYNRRSYKYYITNIRLILERKFLQYQRREILHDRIQDLAVQQSIIGKIFNYGNIIPTSSSGVGTGYDASNIHAGLGLKAPATAISFGMAAGGEKGIVGFRARPNNCVYGIPNPQKTVSLISSLMYERNDVTELEEIKEIMKEIRDKGKL